MTLTLELTPEQEAKLQQKARANGVAPTEYLIRVIEEPKPTETLADRLERLGVLGAFEGKPRADGRPWSEIEGYEFE